VKILVGNSEMKILPSQVGIFSNVESGSLLDNKDVGLVEVVKDRPLSTIELIGFKKDLFSSNSNEKTEPKTRLLAFLLLTLSIGNIFLIEHAFTLEFVAIK
jgi:hypothetical protein